MTIQSKKCIIIVVTYREFALSFKERMHVMKTVIKKILIISLIASLGVAGFGCSSNKVDKDESSISVVIDPDDPALKQDLAFSFPGNSDVDSVESGVDSVEETEESQSGNDSVAEPVTEITTEYVEVTDAAGQTVTEAGGQPVTEVVTTPVEVKPTDVQNPTESTYQAVPDICQAYFLDMTKRGDFIFDGEFLVLEFKIKEGTPDGVYPVTIDSTDIANWEATRIKPACIAGEVVVGDAQSAKNAKPDGTNFTLDVDSVKGKTGDTVQLKIHASQNPGFCGFIIRIQYDSAALEVVDSYGGADFDQAISLVD